jgi:hypothetical protein
MRRILVIAAALLLPIGSADAAVQVKLPACDAINAWAAGVVATDTYNVAPRLALPKAFQDTNIVPVFGVPVLSWAPEDVQAVSAGLVKCYQEAGARKDTAAVTALANANRAVGVVNPTNAALKKAQTDAIAAKQQIDALPDSPELGSAIEILQHANPAAPDGNAYRGISQPITAAIWRLANVALTLADADRAPIYQSLGDRDSKIQAGLSGDADKAIAAATPDTAGIIAVMQARQKVAAIGDADARARLFKSADDKAQQIRDTLRQTKPAVFVPPSCLDLYRWSSAPNAGTQVGLAGRGVATAFLDAQVVPVFGISVADWSDDNLAQFKALRALCASASQPQMAAGPNAAPDAAELVQTASRGHWIDGADQPIIDARTTMVTYRKAQQTMADDLAKIDALPNTIQSFLPLAQIATDPVQNLLSQDDRNRFTNAINAKRAAVSTQSTATAIKGLDDVKVATIADFPKLFGYVGQTMQTIPDQQGQQTFGAAANKTFGDVAARLLPEFQSKLAALPATFDGANQAKGEVAKLTGIPDATGSRLPAMKPYYDAATARSAAIIKGVHDQSCADLLSHVGVGSDASQPVWDGDKGMPLGDFICGLATEGFAIRSYSGSGMFSSTSTLKVAEIKEADETISMHKIDVKPGTSMLVGFKILDANGQQVSMLFAGPNANPKGDSDVTLGVDGWEFFSQAATKMDPRAPEACRPMLALPSPDKLEPDQKLFWLNCQTGPEMLRHPPS